MHWTLHPRKSLWLTLAAAVAGYCFAWLDPRVPVPQLAIGIVSGVAGGILEGRSVAARPEGYLTAETWQQVRPAMTATWTGRVALTLGWITALVLLVTGLFRPSNPLYGMASGYLVMMVVRDLLALPALRDLERAARRTLPSERDCT